MRLKLQSLVTVLLACSTQVAAQVSDTTRDTTKVPRPRPDSVQRDSAAKRDSAARADALARRDSITRRDSTNRDSTRKDSTVVGDSVVIADSTVADTTARDSAVRDSTARRDSTVRDSTTRDSTAIRDSALIPEAAPDPPRAVGRIVASLPAGRTPKDSIALVQTIRAGLTHKGWPVRTPPPRAGALLPAKRIIAFYGNPLSRRMGILGQYAPDSMLARLAKVCEEWQAADSATTVQPALHLIAVVASADAGKDGKYRLRMDSALIERVYGWARANGAILFLDVQPGLSSVMEELPKLSRFLERPDVHLGIDPEFNMRNFKDTIPPGKQIGQLTATEINYSIDFLAKLVASKQLPPKVLVVHRFRQAMVRDAASIRLNPNVQVVMHMDGWGVPSVKFGSYQRYILPEPVQFTGFKLFYRHDTQLGDKLLTPAELLQLFPRPLYIQYQ